MTAALPTFVIIGAMKAGTSTLYSTLRAHPEVFLFPKKEAHFFDERWEQGVQTYAAEFAGRGNAKAWGEATPNYMRFADMCAPRIAETIPDARLIAILRDPVDRAYSHYWHQRGHGRETLSFDAAVDAELAGRRPVGTRADFGYVDGSRYAKQLDVYMTRFTREQLLLLDFAQLTAGHAASVESVLDHIGVTPTVHLAVPTEPVNPYRSPRSRWVYERLRGRRGTAIEMLERLNMKTVPYPKIRPETRQRLQEILAPERAVLATRYGFAVPEWER